MAWSGSRPGVLRLLGMFVRIGTMNEIAYRGNFWLQVFDSIIGLFTAVAAVYLVYRQTDSLNGWSAWELLALVGVYYLVLGSVSVIVAPSLTRFVEDVRLGKLDYTLTKPVDAQLLVSVSEVEIWRVGDLFLGSVVLGTAAVQLARQTSLVSVAAFAVALACGLAIVYAFWLILASLSFWLVRVENILFVFWSMYEAGRWPVTIYPPWLRWILTVVVPIAFAVTVPAQAVTGRLSGRVLVFAVLFAVVLLVFSRWLWRRGLEQYSGASA